MRRPPLIAYPAREGTAPSAGVLALGWLAVACSEPSDARVRVGPDCAAWIETARRAQRCDTVLKSLAATVEQHPNEARCRAAARSLLRPTTTAASEIKSLYTSLGAPEAGPLTPAEHRALETLEFPAMFELVPDIRGEPGLTPTRAWLDDRELGLADDGRLHTMAPQGQHTLRIKHGDDERLYCVHLGECTRPSVMLHGAQVARHAAVAAGPCATNEES